MTNADWVELASIAAAVTGFFTALMAVAIIVTAFYAKGTLTQAKTDSRNRTRPVLVASLHRELLAHGTIMLVIKNFGPSSATDVRISFDPPAPSTEEVETMPDGYIWKWVYQRFNEPVPVWAPGWSTANVIRTGGDSLDPFTVMASYLGPDGTGYEDQFQLNPAPILKETTATPSQATDQVVLAQQVVAALHALVRTVRDQ